MDPERFRKGNGGHRSDAADNLAGLPPPPPHTYTPPKVHKHSAWPWVVSVVVLALLVGVGVWAYSNHKPKPANHNTASSKQAAKSSKSNAPNEPAVPTTSYNSTNFNTSFDYPTGWTIVDSGSAPLTVTSPALSLTAANGQSVEGQIVVTIAKGGSLPSAFTTQSVAVLSSQDISYTQPSTSQAAQTYISFVQYPSTNIVGGLDGIYITGNFGYQKAQAIPSSDISSIDPLVYTSFYSCSSTTCPIASRQPLTISSTEWENTSFSAPLLTLFKSFTFN